MLVLKELAQEIIRLMQAWAQKRPTVARSLFVLLGCISLVILIRIGGWFFFSPPTIPLGRVNGRIFLNDTPLDNATIEFTPSDGSPSYGLTDERGAYSLMYLPGKNGALTGDHTVRITTYDWITLNDGTKQERPERVPDRYNAHSTLKATVSRGAQQYDWHLEAP